MCYHIIVFINHYATANPINEITLPIGYSEKRYRENTSESN